MNPFRITPIIRDVVLNPFYGIGAVLNERRKPYFGVNPVIGHDGYDSFFREGMGDEDIVATVAILPAPP